MGCYVCVVQRVKSVVQSHSVDCASIRSTFSQVSLGQRVELFWCYLLAVLGVLLGAVGAVMSLKTVGG